jgi:short-subunit dehydrogenase
MEMQGKVIVITGAAQGLGCKMAEIWPTRARISRKLQDTVRLC